MRAVFRAGMDVGVESAVGLLDVLDGIGREILRQRRFHLLLTVDHWAGAGDRDANVVPGLRDINTDDCIARRRVRELHVMRLLRDREADSRDDFARFESGLEKSLEEIVGRDLALVGYDRGVE